MANTTAATPLISVIIPHYLGDVLSRCVDSLIKTRQNITLEIVVVDDQPRDDGSITRAREVYPGLIVTKTHGSHGFGAACNAGIKTARGKYLAIINNDAVVDRDWLAPLLRSAEAQPDVAVLQSKIRSLQHPERFDYSGGAGGLMDCLGFPFALGRVFDSIEDDRGQFDEPQDIFWAVGAAMFIRRSALEAAGGFDEAFTMHMEEIDLCWRLQLAGYRVRSCPQSVVYHENGHTLKQGSFRKEYLNHRNNLTMLVKNLPWSRLAWVFPLRIVLILGIVLLGLVKRNWRQPLAAILGTAWLFANLVGVLRRRRAARAVRPIEDAAVLSALRPGSIVLDYFLRRMSLAQIVVRAQTPAIASFGRTQPAKVKLATH